MIRKKCAAHHLNYRYLTALCRKINPLCRAKPVMPVSDLAAGLGRPARAAVVFII
ncbi:MAG: hypothetical protein Q8L40_07130 [Burkholderiales bacterium]|nr:hypothetical protein [Burkholderiales bacterium]